MNSIRNPISHNLLTAVIASIALTLAACDSGEDDDSTDLGSSNNAPTFTSSSSVSVPENTSSSFYTAEASDDDGDALTYSISGGLDKDFFVISASGALHFSDAPDYETPQDDDSDNDYLLELSAGDGQGGSTNLSLTVSVSDVGAPSAPTNFQSEAGDGSVDLTWDAVSGADVYHLYMAEVSGVTASNYAELTGGMAHTDISTNSYRHTGLTNGTTYYFVVVASNYEGNSSVSAEVGATPTADTSGSAPDTPANLQASVGDGSVDLTWDTVSDADVYHLYMAEVSGVTASNYAELVGGMVHTDISTNYYSHTGLTNGTTYYFVVVAGNSDGNSSISTEVSATPAASTSGSAPDTPANLQASAGDGSVDLTWDAVSGADVYHLYMAEVSGVTASNYAELAGGMAHTNVSTNSYSHSGLTNGTAYYFVVAAGNSYGNSSISTEVSATPIANTSTSSELTLALDLSSSDYSSLMVTEELAEVEQQQAQSTVQEAGSKLSFANGSLLKAQNTTYSSAANFFALDGEDNVHAVFTNSDIYFLYIANDPTGKYIYLALDIDQSADFVKLSQCALYRIELATNKVLCVEPNYAPAAMDSSFTAALEYQGLKPVQFVTSDDSTSETTNLSGVFYLGRPFTVSNDNISWDSASNPLIRKLDIASDGSVSSATTISSDIDTIKSFALLADGLLVYHFSNELSAGLKLYDNGSTNVITDSADSADSDYFYSSGDNSDVLMYGKVNDDERIMRFMRSAAGGAVNKKELPAEMINGESTVRVISADDGFVYALTYDESAEALNFYQLMPFDATPIFSIDVSGSNLAQALDNKVQLYINHAYYVASASHPQGSYSDRDVINIVKKYNGETRTLLNDEAWSQRYDIYKWKQVKDEIHFAGFDNSTSKMIYGRVDLTAVENNAADSEILSISEISSVLGVSSDILDLEEIRPDAPNKYEAGNPKLEFHTDERNPYAATVEFTKYMNKDDVADGTSIDSASSTTTDHFYAWYYKSLHIVYDQDASNSMTDYLSDDTKVSIDLDGEIRDYSGFYLSNGMDAEDLNTTYTINLDANQPPIAIITGGNFDLNGYVAKPGEVLAIDASSSYDPDNDTISYLWSLSPANYAYIDDYQVATTNLIIDSGISDASILLQLTVCDSNDSCSTDDLVLEISGNAPSTPSAPSVSVASSSSINISWSTVADATYYQLYRNTTNSSSSASLVYSSSETFAADTGLAANTQYYYWISACNSVSCSNLSEVTTATTYEEEQSFPATPAAPTVSATGSSSVSISWSSSSDATYYQLYQNTSDGSSSSASKVYEGSATSTSQTGLSASTIYYYWLKACNDAGCSSFSDAAIATTDEDIPEAAIPEAITTGSNSIGVSWSSVTGASYYELYQGDSEISSFASLIYEGSELAKSVANLNANTRYFYWLKSCNAVGCSEFSETVQLYTLPIAVASITFANVSSNSLDIDWDSPAGGASYYEIYRDGLYVNSTQSTLYSDGGLAPEQTYQYFVLSCNADSKCSQYTAIETVSTLEAVPNTPTITSAEALSSSAIDVSWSLSSNGDGGQVTYYELYYSTSTSTSGMYQAGGNITNTTYSLSGLSTGVTYYVRVKACNGTGCSDFSEYSQEKTLEATLNLFNDASIAIPYVYLSPTSSSTWGSNIKTGGYLYHAESFTKSGIACGIYYDLMVQSVQPTYHDERNIYFGCGSTVSITIGYWDMTGNYTYPTK